MFCLFRIACRENPKARGNFKGFAREIGTDDLPTVSRIGRFEKYVGRKIERVRLERRKNNRQGARVTILAAANRFRRDLRVFADILLRSREPVAIKNVGIERVDRDVTVFEKTDEMPIAKCDFTVIAWA